MTENEIRRELIKNLDLILDASYDDLLITDGKGTVLKVNPTFEQFYDLKKEDAVGKTVYQLEEEGYFKPSVVAMALEQNKKLSLRQKNNKDRDILVTATPVFDDDNNIEFVISFSRDVTEMLELQRKYSMLENKVEKYEAEIQVLRNFETEGYIICKSEKSKDVVQSLKRVATYDANVILTGPSGVGKTLFARELHKYSSRSKGPFVDVNCAAIPANLLESELFGYEKGAFTGASTKGKMGFFELADGGTLFLDEISEMPMSLQAKLLKAIQDKVIIRVGGIRGKKINFRLVTASNRSLEASVEKGEFRRDLFYRLNVLNIYIPPLAERKEDIVPLCEHFLNGFNKKYDMNKIFSSDALKSLMNYSWPGNVREVANIVERTAMMTSGDVIEKIYFDGNDSSGGEASELLDLFESIDINEELERVEGEIIRKAYNKYRNSTEVARALSISQPTAYRKIKKYIVEE